MYSIDFQTEYEGAEIPVERMTAAICDVLDGFEEIDPESGVTVVITDDAHVRALNKQFRGVDAATDVLSFPADPPPEALDPTEVEPDYLGDLIIAYPYTKHQAEELGHALADELVLLVVHGTLHLLGFDHDTPEHQDEMWAEQAEVLARAGVSIVVPRYTFEDTSDSNG